MKNLLNMTSEYLYLSEVKLQSLYVHKNVSPD